MAEETVSKTEEEAIKPETARNEAVKAVQFGDLEQPSVRSASAPGNINLLLDVSLRVTVQLGKTKMLIKDLLHMGQGSVVELDKLAGDPMDIFIGEKLIARGEIVVVNDMFGVRITDIISPAERIETLNK